MQWSKLMEHGFRAYNKSLGYLKQALELARKLEEKISEANILAEMGYMERKRKDYPLALEYYCMAVEIFVQQGKKKNFFFVFFFFFDKIFFFFLVFIPIPVTIPPQGTSI